MWRICMGWRGASTRMCLAWRRLLIAIIISEDLAQRLELRRGLKPQRVGLVVGHAQSQDGRLGECHRTILVTILSLELCQSHSLQ